MQWEQYRMTVAATVGTTLEEEYRQYVRTSWASGQPTRNPIEGIQRIEEESDCGSGAVCGGSGKVLYEPGPNQHGEVCPGCPKCQP